MQKTPWKQPSYFQGVLEMIWIESSICSYQPHSEAKKEYSILLSTLQWGPV